MVRGRRPKPANVRQNKTRKAGAAEIAAPENPKVPALPKFDGRTWHYLTHQWWRNTWRSEMATQFLESDRDTLIRLAILIDDYYQEPSIRKLAEIRQQEARFGLSPLDRSRLQWEIQRGEEAEGKRHQPRRPSGNNDDVDTYLKAVK